MKRALGLGLVVLTGILTFSLYQYGTQLAAVGKFPDALPSIKQHGIGDDRYTIEEYEEGLVFLCDAPANSNLQIATSGKDWIFNDYWQVSLKPVVSGLEIIEGALFSETTEDATRVLTSNGVPNHAVGIFPIPEIDTAYQFDTNDRAITEQSITMTIPKDPALSYDRICIPREIYGLALSGAPFHSPFDESNQDTRVYRMQDSCNGHTDASGHYHYHGASSCLENIERPDHTLVGYALDGFGIFGAFNADGTMVTNKELDGCHGHTHDIDWDGVTKEMYHYHTTDVFPYTVSCLRGKEIGEVIVGE